MDFTMDYIPHNKRINIKTKLLNRDHRLRDTDNQTVREHFQMQGSRRRMQRADKGAMDGEGRMHHPRQASKGRGGGWQ